MRAKRKDAARRAMRVMMRFFFFAGAARSALAMLGDTPYADASARAADSLPSTPAAEARAARAADVTTTLALRLLIADGAPATRYTLPRHAATPCRSMFAFIFHA